MKQKRSLLILLGILVVVSGAYIGALKYTESKEAAELAAELELEEASVIHITEIAEEDIVAVTWTYEEELTFEKDGEEWVYVDNANIPIQDSYITTIVQTFCDLTATRELVDGDSLGDYGLEDEVYSVILTQESGEETVYYIGNAASEDYYITIDDKTNIYTASSTVVSNISYGLTSIVENDTFPSVASTQMVEVSIVEGEEETIYTADDEGAFDLIATGISELSFTSCVDCEASYHLEDYGLDEESKIVVTISYTEEVEVEESDEESDEEADVEVIDLETILYVGTYDESMGIYYVQVEGSDFVYSMASDTVSSVMNLY